MTAQPNYTEEMVAKMIADYQDGTSVDEIAEAIGKSVRSVRSKLVREGVYVATPKAAKAPKAEGPTKKEMLNTLEELAPFAVDGFMGATKAAIGDLIAFLQESGAESVATDPVDTESDVTPEGRDVAETAVDETD